MKITNLSFEKPKFGAVKFMLKDKLISRFTKGFAISMAIFLTIGILKWQRLPPQIPLFYSLPRSPDQLTPSIFILILPILSIIFFAVNFAVAYHFYQKEKLASIILIATATIVSFLSLIAFIKIVFLIT